MRNARIWLVLLVAIAMFAVSCGSDGDGDDGGTAAADAGDDGGTAEPPPPPPAADPPAPAPDPAPAPSGDDGGSGEAVQIAYLSASTANTWLAASRAAMDKVAADNNIEIVEFDAQFDPALQQQQFQDAISSGQYGGIVLVSLVGSGSIPDIEEALAAGIEVVALNQVVSDDLTSVDPGIDGLAAAVFEPPQLRGERIGELTVQACADRDPCNVVYFYGIRGIPLDEAVRAGWDSVVAGTGITVVAEAEGQYLGPDVGLSAMQDVLISTPEIDVVVGADQSMQGVELAIEEAGTEGISIVGFGGSSYAVDAIADGRWWGGLYGAPATEGELAMQAMIDALGGSDTGGVDPSLSVPNGGLMTPDNIGDFTAQWDG